MAVTANPLARLLASVRGPAESKSTKRRRLAGLFGVHSPSVRKASVNRRNTRYIIAQHTELNAGRPSHMKLTVNPRKIRRALRTGELTITKEEQEKLL